MSLIDFDKRFQHPTSILIAGPTKSGKTHFVYKIFKQRLIQPWPANIIWIYGEYQSIYDELKDDLPDIHFIEGLPKNLNEYIDPSRTNMLLIDDQMSEAGGTKELENLFTKGSHHKDMTVIYIVQNLFDKGKSHRTVSLNAQYLVVFKNPRDKTQITHLAQQMYPENSKFLTKSFEDATKVPHGYLLMDLRQETAEELRVRSKIFEDECTVVYSRA